MRTTILSLLLFIVLTGLYCKDEPTKPSDPSISLVAEDASCTEVWLKLSVKNVANPTVSLKRDDSLIATYILISPDTTIVDEGLLPNRNYTYTAQLLNGSMASSSTARTMDATSHDFTFQTFTLGDGTGSSCLYDVAIINDTLGVMLNLKMDFY